MSTMSAIGCLISVLAIVPVMYAIDRAPNAKKTAVLGMAMIVVGYGLAVGGMTP